jgi:AraC-like DNA-binding protein
MTTIALQRTSHASDETLPPHRHREAYVALVLCGSYLETGPDGAWPCEAGDLVIHPPFHLHGDRMSRQGAKVLNFILPLGPIAEPTALRAVSTYAVVRPKEPGQVERAAARDPWGALAAALADGDIRARPPASDWRDRIACALAAGSAAPIGGLARAEGVSSEHASRAFQARYGIGPARFRAERRLRQALQALAETTDALADVADDAGYADQAHLTRAVKAATGMTPARLRAALGAVA